MSKMGILIMVYVGLFRPNIRQSFMKPINCAFASLDKLESTSFIRNDSSIVTFENVNEWTFVFPGISSVFSLYSVFISE